MTKRTRVHILTTVNASAVSKTGGTYTVSGVCGAIDGIVMNGAMYPGTELADGAASLEGKPAPAGHPKNDKGQFISALNGEALASAWIGSYVRNARHEGGRTLTDIMVNEAQAKAHPDGAKLVERLDAAINGSNVDPIHVSTGLLCRMLEVNGESRGKKYTKVATNIEYDHLAILLNEQGAGTPADGVGMFLNAAGQEEAVEVANLSTEPEDKRFTGLMGWIRKLLGNGSEISLDQIREGLYAGLPEYAWVTEVFQRYAIWCDREGKHWQQDYTVSSDGSVAFSGNPIEVTRRVSYEPVTNHDKEADIVKDKILAALNAAGITTEGLDEAQLLTAYNTLVSKPVSDKLVAANAQLQQHADTAKAAEQAEAKTIAEKLVVGNSLLKVDDLMALPVARLRELAAANTTAAPVLPAGGGGAKGAGDEFKDYSLNSFVDEATKKGA